jgi:hypothetical protein
VRVLVTDAGDRKCLAGSAFRFAEIARYGVLCRLPLAERRAGQRATDRNAQETEVG